MPIGIRLEGCKPYFGRYKNLATMPILTASLFSIAKGAIFLAKSAAVKGFLAKYGAYIVHHYGWGVVAKTTIAASAVTGTALAINSAINKTKEGYCLIIDGIDNRSYSQFFNGILQLTQSGMNVDSIIDGFKDFVDNWDCDYDVKISFKDTMEDLRGLICDHLGQKTISLIKEAEELLKQNDYSNELYIEQVNAIYHEHTDDIEDNYTLLLGCAGRIYSDMCDLNILSGLRKQDSNEYDHYLVYCIAGWFKDHLTLNCLWNKNQKQLADDITNHILDYLEVSSLKYYWR